MRVLFLTAYPAIGGPLPKLAPLVVEGLRRDGCDVVVEGWSAHSAGRESVVSKVSGRSVDLLRVRARISVWRPDVVLVATTHNWPALLRDVPLGLLMPRDRPPLVLQFHGSECGELGRRGRRTFSALSRWLVQRAAAVLVLSTEELGIWERFAPRARFEVVANPFVPTVRGEKAPAAPRLRGASQPPALLFVGRLTRAKGVFELLDAFSIVRRRCACRLVIAGVGPAAEDIERRVHLLGLRGDVEMRGYLTGDALDDAYRDASVFVLPSYREGFPLVVMEAMDHGLPVVTTPIRGCADHLTPDVNALFAPPRDVEALAAALTRLLEDDPLRARMGTANRARVAAFAPAAVIPRYVEILRSVVGSEGSSR